MTIRPGLLLAILLVGCRADGDAGADPATPEPMTRRVLHVHELPVMALSLEEAFAAGAEGVDAGLRRRLAGDGIRLAVGRVADLPELVTDAGIGSTTTRSVVAVGTGPQQFDFPVIARDAARELTLFWTTDAGVRGRSFGPATMALDITYDEAPPLGEATGVVVEVVPRVDSLRRRTLFLATGEDRQLDDATRESLADAGFSVRVPDDGYLLVGPSPEAARGTSLGHHLFRDADSGAAELLLLIPGRVSLAPIETRVPSSVKPFGSEDDAAGQR